VLADDILGTQPGQALIGKVAGAPLPSDKSWHYAH